MKNGDMGTPFDRRLGGAGKLRVTRWLRAIEAPSAMPLPVFWC